MMLQGVPALIPNSGDGGATASSQQQQQQQPQAQAAQAQAQAHEGGGGGGDVGGGSTSGGFSEEDRGRIEEGERNSGGNRWPRQETLALLKIRSDMDVAFRDSSLKGPLWDEVSRKLAELGYHRSSKKCKEKFENVYKYHKRTKEGRTSKADGKTYRFFDQLEALEANPAATHHHHHHPPPPLSLPAPPPPPPSAAAKPPQVSAAMPNNSSASAPVPQVVTYPSISISESHQNNVNPISVAAPAVTMPTTINHVGGFPFSHPNMSGSTDSTSSSTSSDEEPPERRRKRKRKWKDFFGRLMKEVIDKQEELQMKFLDTIERRERDRIAREEAWRVQEMAKMNREHELLVQERSIAAAKDAAVITFLQKITEQNPNVVQQMPVLPILQQQQQQQNQQTPPSQPPPQPSQPAMQQQQQPPPQQYPVPVPVQVQPVAVAVPVTVPAPAPVPVPALPPAPSAAVGKNLDNGGGSNGGGENMLSPSPSRWPKAEVNALIRLRTTLDMKYQESGPKGPLWEEISSSMRKLGYNRNAKRCKEKWENINKYYKKVKESSKKRPEDSKTCPYFHQLDAIYRERAANTNTTNANNNPGFMAKPETTTTGTTQMAPIMARPEQQWPLPAAVQQHQQQQQRSTTNESTAMDHDHESENVDQNNEEDYDDDDEDEEDEGGEYEIVPNKSSSMATVE